MISKRHPVVQIYSETDIWSTHQPQPVGSSLWWVNHRSYPLGAWSSISIHSFNTKLFLKRSKTQFLGGLNPSLYLKKMLLSRKNWNVSKLYKKNWTPFAHRFSNSFLICFQTGSKSYNLVPCIHAFPIFFFFHLFQYVSSFTVCHRSFFP